MSQFTQVVLLTSMVQMCGGTSSSSSSSSSDFFSCEDYQLMIDVELKVGQACSVDADCTQELIQGDESCDANAIVVNDDYETSYFYDLYDEATAAGCSISLDMNTDCSLSDVVCSSGTCGWN